MTRILCDASIQRSGKSTALQQGPIVLLASPQPLDEADSYIECSARDP